MMMIIESHPEESRTPKVTYLDLASTLTRKPYTNDNTHTKKAIGLVVDLDWNCNQVSINTVPKLMN
jgi:hypothetical protein